MKGETKEKAEGGRMSRRSRSNVCTVSQRHWGTEAKTIIYKNERENRMVKLRELRRSVLSKVQRAVA